MSGRRARLSVVRQAGAPAGQFPDEENLRRALNRSKYEKSQLLERGMSGWSRRVCLAHWGHTVTCVEIDVEKACDGSKQDGHDIRKDVEELMNRCAQRLSYTDDYGEACRGAQAIFICVGTPEREDGYANLKYVFAAAEQIAQSVYEDCICVLKSTVPIGTHHKLDRLFFSKTRKGICVEVASNPEFLSQGLPFMIFCMAPGS
jgi:UDPglucose 6-dehydrogenase